MKFECPSCAKKYSLPDEKVPAGKDFKVKCKKCGEIIVLRAPDPSEAAPVEEQAPPVEEPAQEQASQQASAFGQPAAADPFGQQAGGGPFDQQAGGPFDAPAEAPAAAPEPSAPDEGPTRVFDYSSMGDESADPVQAASAQAEAFQAPQAEAFQAPPEEPVQEEAPPAEAAPGTEELEWHIAVDGDQMGPYDTAQMLEMMAANQINEETYVWRDGYDDWLPLSDVSELQGAGAPAAAPAPAPAAASPGSPFAIASGGSSGQDLFASAGSEGGQDGSPFAAPAADGGVSTSLGADPQSPRVDAGDLKGARHENSVLFSLSSLQALASSSRDPAPAGGLGAATSEGGSGLIDIKSLTAGASSLAASDAPPSDDILSIGGGGIGSPVGVPSLLQPAKREPSKLPYILAGVFGLIAIAGIAVVLVVVLGRDKGTEIDEEALRAKIMAELMASGMTEKEAKEKAAETAAAQVAEAEGETEGESAEGEGEGEEEGATSGGKKKKGGKKKGGSTGGGGDDSTPTSPTKAASTGGGKPSAAEDDLMALLGGAVKKKPTKKTSAETGTKPATTPTKPAADLPEKPTKQDVMKALNGVKPKVQACGKGATGVATVSINIAGSTGKVASAKVVSGPFKGTPNAGCIENAVKKAKFGKFKQAKFSVSYPFVIK